jgi:hypothetical protein
LFTLDSPKASVPACIKPTDIKAPIAARQDHASIPGLWQPLSPPYRHDLHASPPSSVSVSQTFKRAARRASVPFRLMCSRFMPQCLPTACKDSPDPIVGTSLADDAAANFKCFASPAFAPDVLFGLGAGADASRGRAWLDLSFSNRDRPESLALGLSFWGIKPCFWRMPAVREGRGEACFVHHCGTDIQTIPRGSQDIVNSERESCCQ